LIFLFPLLASIGFSLLALWHVLHFEKKHFIQRPWKGEFQACILRPLRGADEKTKEILATMCRQTIPPAEIRYGVDDPNDSAVRVVEALKKEYPQIPMLLFVGKNSKIPNGKIANLASMAHEIQTPIVVCVDQDIVVEKDYLEKILSPFFDPHVGLVTCAYRVANPKTFWSAFELLALHADFFPSILVAESMEKGLRFAFGATMAVRKSVLEELGGFESLGNYLADDYELGRRVAKAGHAVVLSNAIVEHDPGVLNFRTFWQRQLRAARTHRVCRPGGYALSLFTQGFPWLAGLFSVVGFSWLTLSAGAVWLFCRCLLAAASHAVLTKNATKRPWWPIFFLPIHELFRFIFWILAFLGNHVVWGGKVFYVAKNGTFTLKGRF
jgi:ceramide glucosyltransferase